jgi:hypothetical protein
MGRKPGSRVAALNCSEQRVAELFVRRATCCDQKVLRVEAPLQTFESEERLYEEVRMAIALGAGAESALDFDPAYLTHLKRPLIVVLQRQVTSEDTRGIPRLTLARLLERLRRDFPTCVFLILTGPVYDRDIDALIPPGGRAEPALEPDVALDVVYTVNRLYRDVGVEGVAS